MRASVDSFGESAILLIIKIRTGSLNLSGTGLNCTKTKMHEAKIARGHKMTRVNKIARRQFCTSYIFARKQNNKEKKINKKKVTDRG